MGTLRHSRRGCRLNIPINYTASMSFYLFPICGAADAFDFGRCADDILNYYCRRRAMRLDRLVRVRTREADLSRRSRAPGCRCSAKAASPLRALPSFISLFICSRAARQREKENDTLKCAFPRRYQHCRRPSAAARGERERRHSGREIISASKRAKWRYHQLVAGESRAARCQRTVWHRKRKQSEAVEPKIC